MKKYLTNGLDLSLCENCWCMTHSYIDGGTGKEICMKCGCEK